jgi:hypothetical protein
VEIAETVVSVSRERREGALVTIQRRGRVQEGEERAFEALIRVAHEVPSLTCFTTSWLRHEAVVEGSREALLAVGGKLFHALLAHPDTRWLTWAVIMVRVFPGEGERTLRCDPGYDVKAQAGSGLFWVEPYAKPDWQKPQRYPTTTLVKVVEPGSGIRRKALPGDR